MASHLSLRTLALAAAMLPLPSLSQAMPMDCGGMGGMHGGEGHGDFSERRAERMQQHQKRLHDALKLTQEQEGAWKKLSDASQPLKREARPATEEWNKMTAPERAEKMLDLSKRHQERMATHVAALKEFYAALTPEQKKTFDEYHRAPRGERRGPRSNDKAVPGSPN